MSKHDEKHAFVNGGPPDQSPSGTNIPMPAPTLPEYVEQSMPPPSYEEIMGHQTQTSVQHETTSDIPPLAYVDIMPRLLEKGNIKYKVAPKFDKFSYTMEVANEWLRTNPGYAVWKCETVERKVDAGHPGGPPVIEMDKTTIHHATYGFNVFVRGVRMWLVKKTDGTPPQQLGLMNVVPDKKIIEWASYRHRAFMLDDPFYRSHVVSRHFVTYDDFTETIVKLNSRLKANPLPGTILNVEGATMKTFVYGDDVSLDPDDTSYSSEHKMKRSTQILRIFFIRGPPSHEEIHLQEIVPEMTRPGAGFSNPQWQSWAEVNGKLGGWLSNSRGVRVVNIQAYNAKVSRGIERAVIMTDCTDEIQSSFLARDYVKILRVFYTTGSPIQSQPVVNFSSRLFVPARIGRRTFEGMAQTMYRIEAWLRAAGLPIYNVETVQYLLVEHKPFGVEFDKCAWSENPNLGNIFVTAIRVYFPCTYMEPDPRLLPPQPYYDPAAGGDCCTLS